MNPKYTQLQDGFRKWLNTIGYAESTVYASTIIGFFLLPENK